MKYIQLVFLCVVVTACDSNTGVNAPEEISVSESTGSFRNRGGEIGAEIIDEMEKQGIEHWFNDDGTIGYYLADGDKIDAIAYYARGKYAARN